MNTFKQKLLKKITYSDTQKLRSKNLSDVEYWQNEELNAILSLIETDLIGEDEQEHNSEKKIFVGIEPEYRNKLKKEQRQILKK